MVRAQTTKDRPTGKNVKSEVLRFMTCGSVDDGKSTLIGRMLFEANSLYDDQLSSLREASEKYGTQGGKTDYALLLDGLAAEREQGITIDVAYRYFSTPRRKFIVSDAPGHEQYTRNMATAASNVDLVVVLIDARYGITQQTKRHMFIASLFGVKHLAVSINKMDLVNFDQDTYEKIKAEVSELNKTLKFSSVTSIPISAFLGDNITEKSPNTKWFDGQPLLKFLEDLELDTKVSDQLRLPIQYVNRPDQNFRGYCGTVSKGTIGIGDDINILPSNIQAKISKIFVADEERSTARSNETVTVTLNGEYDVSRGDILVSPIDLPDYSEQFLVNIIWLSEDRLLPGRQYIFQAEAQETNATVLKINHKVDFDNLSSTPAKELEMNDLAECVVSLTQKVVMDTFERNKRTGSFILINRETLATVGAGTIKRSLGRGENIYRHSTTIERKQRSALKKQLPFTLWFTGLSGAGKSTIANEVEQKLFGMSFHTMLLDGDNVRFGLNRDLGFSNTDRIENIRRTAEVARLLNDAGLIAIVAFISPFVEDREAAKEIIGPKNFVEVFVDAPMSELLKRDPKGLYKKALSGNISNFTGVNSPYEVPQNPDLKIDTSEVNVQEASNQIISLLEKKLLL